MDEKIQIVARELTDFAFDQFEWYRVHNPAVAKILDEIVGDERFPGETANVFFPIFYTLQKMQGDGGMPIISEETAQRAIEERRNAKEVGFVEREFGHWLDSAPDVVNFFRLFLGALVKPEEKPEVYDGAKKAFALILYMIRLEKQRRPR